MSARCAHCGALNPRASRKYCSDLCKTRAAYNRRPRVPCDICGKPTGWAAGRVESARHNACIKAQASHGTDAKYRHGCRCDLCRRAVADRMNEYLRRRYETGSGPTCTVDDFSRPHAGRGMCHMHLRRWHRDNGTLKRSDTDWNSPAALARRRQREALKRGAAAEGEAFTVRDLLDRDGICCHLCGREIAVERRWPDPMSPSIDHIVPISRGGVHSAANAKAAHLRCNLSRGNRPVVTLPARGTSPSDKP